MSERRDTLDRLGIAASTLCAIHCTAGAVLSASPTVVALFIRDERLERAFVVATLVVGGFAFAMGRRRVPRAIVVLWCTGALMLLVSRGVESWERPLSIVAAAAIVCAHLLNVRARRHA